MHVGIVHGVEEIRQAVHDYNKASSKPRVFLPKIGKVLPDVWPATAIALRPTQNTIHHWN
jgi:hypothetical protein